MAAQPLKPEPSTRRFRRLQRLDTRLFLWLQSLGDNRRRPAIPYWLSRSGDGYLPLLVIVGALLLHTPASIRLAWLFGIAYAIERPLYWILKNTLRRRRPVDALPEFHSHITASDRFSFPSGHTSAAVLFTCLIAPLLPPMWVGVPMIWAMSVGISRVMLGVHFPSDIIAGAILGFLVNILALNAYGAFVAG